MDELQKLQDKLERYRAMRSFTDDKRTIETLDMMIAETEHRLAQIERDEATDRGHE
jgi:hypothetical protein